MYNAVGAADIRRSIVPGYLTANENSFSLPSLSIFLILPTQSSLAAPYLRAARSLFPSLARARSLALSLSASPLPSIHCDSLFPLFSSTVISPSPAHHNRSSPVYFPSLHFVHPLFFSPSFSFSPPLHLLLPLSVTILSCAR